MSKTNRRKQRKTAKGYRSITSFFSSSSALSRFFFSNARASTLAFSAARSRLSFSPSSTRALCRISWSRTRCSSRACHHPSWKKNSDRMGYFLIYPNIQNIFFQGLRKWRFLWRWNKVHVGNFVTFIFLKARTPHTSIVYIITVWINLLDYIQLRCEYIHSIYLGVH